MSSGGPAGPAGPESQPLSNAAQNGVGHGLSANGPSANGAASQQRSSTSPAGTAQNGVAPSKNSASGAGAGDSPEKEKEKEKDGEGQAETVAPTPTGEEVDFKKISIAEALRVLKVNEGGLTSDEHAKRLEEYGPNKLPESTRNPILVYLGYMWNPLSWAMECAVILAVALLDYADFCLIIALLLTNATISYVEESNADQAIKALTAALAPKAKAIRNGKPEVVDATQLVPGDIVVVRLGEIVPADIKLMGETGEEDHPMQVDQAALTGESLPVKKFSGDVCFSGSSIKQGEKHAIVYATGANTFFGRAAALISGTNNVANLQKIMTRIGACCLITIGVWVCIEVIVAFAAYHHTCQAGADRCPALTNLLVIIVGGIPIAMPTVLSVTLALGAFRLAKEGAIVARMSAVEEMAGMDILCSDKTGTLTLNKLSVDANTVFAMSGHSVEDVLKFAALSAQRDSDEAIDKVLQESYQNVEALYEQYEFVKFIPFNPTDKYTIAFIKDKHSGETIRLMKGAPQIVLKKAHNHQEIVTAGTQKITEFANRGFRALGIAKGPATGPTTDVKWEMMGLLPLYDPPRHDTKDTIDRCIDKGLMVKMITGDQALIGRETAKQLGMGSGGVVNIFNTEVLLKARDGKGCPEGFKDAQDLLERADGFAEVFPEHKFLIVELLQKAHHMVGMTGDGVNDAPALKKADVGIAVDGATDAARGAADIVLTKPGLSTIVSAIIGSRKIFQRMTTYSKYTVAMTFRICFTFGLLTCIYNWFFPTILIVLLAVFNDGAMIALSKDRVEASATPDQWNLAGIFTTGIVYGLYLTLSTWALYFTATHTQFFRDRCHTFSLNTRAKELNAYCYNFISSLGYSPTDNICIVPEYRGQGPCVTGGTGRSATIQEQCYAEQFWVRNSMTRSLLYAQVSISGQGLVFVVRTVKYSVFQRAGLYTYIAFFCAQILASIIAGIGFGGYDYPVDGFGNCQFCRLSYRHGTGGWPFAMIKSHNAPAAGTESVFLASVVACTGYVIVAWVWALMWYVALDPIKWAMAYILDEEGIRTGKRGMIDPAQRSKANEEQQHGMYMGRVSKNNPLGRVSVSRPSPAQLERASVARVGPPPPGQRNSIGRNSLGRTSLGRTSAGRPGAAKGSMS